MKTPTDTPFPDDEVNEDDMAKPGPEESLRAVRIQALDLVGHLQAIATDAPREQKPAWLAHIGMLQDLVLFVERAQAPAAPPKSAGPALTAQQLQEFGKLLRDKRNAASLSRIRLARKAKLSDATIKFLETARHPPSRATLIRLISVEELKLTWADVPGHPSPPAAERPPVVEMPELTASLNCWMTPTSEPVREVLALGRVLNGAGGHVEQTNAYLDHQSAAAYIALCQQSSSTAGLRASAPMAEAARRILAVSGPVGFHIIALGPGDGTLEVRLVQHLVETAHTPSTELSLLDISQPMLSCAYKHAADALGVQANVRIWAMQCNFHDLPLYSQMYLPHGRRKRQRIFCMLGGTLADLDSEPRFFQHSLQGCSRGDLLLLDMRVARSATLDPEEIKKRDKAWSRGLSSAQAAWLAGPLWRHCKDLLNVQFHWNLDTHCPVPGSYALDAVATVQVRGREDRQFSMFRFRRYTPSKLAECLSQLGWDEIGALPYGGAEPASLQLFCKRTGGT